MDIPAAAQNAIKESLACEIIGFTLATTLYGITVLQGYFYFRQYWDDSIRLKSLVIVLLITDTLTTVFMAHAMYTYVVLDFGSPLKIDLITWSFSSENGFAVITAFIVQCYFGHRLWILGRKNILLVGLIFLLAFLNLAMGMACTIPTFTHHEWATLGTLKNRITLGLYSGASSLCDALIAAGLCYYLQTSRTGLRVTDTLIDKLMVYAIERGILTTTCQIMHMILTVALPGRAIFLPFAMLESKLYANALLATLNVRKSLSGKESIQLGGSQLRTVSLFPARNHDRAPNSTFVTRSAGAGTDSVSTSTVQFASQAFTATTPEDKILKDARAMNAAQTV